jgi:hypothetical protein
LLSLLTKCTIQTDLSKSLHHVTVLLFLLSRPGKKARKKLLVAIGRVAGKA